MSLYRQLWMALVLTTLLAVIGSLLASTFSTRTYLAEQLRVKNADNATALALSLSRPGVDELEIELAASAMFDTGHYELIRIVSPAGQTLVERTSQTARAGAPEWFITLLPIQAPAGQALISDGWRQVGSVTLLSHSRFAYQALWQSTLLLILTLTLTGLLAGSLGSLILRRLKRPLDSVIQQAKAITERRFVTSPEPDVPELRQLSAAMNFAVTQLKAMFEEEAARLETVRYQANHDPVTGLANRRHFMSGLSTLLASPESPAGTLMILRITGLAEMNQALGRPATDRVLRAIGEALRAHARDIPDALAARLNGPDFALLLPAVPPSDARVERLLQAVQAPLQPHQANAPVYLGFGAYQHGMELSHVLAQVDNALAKAEAAGFTTARATEFADSARGEGEWSAVLRSALDNQRTRLASFPVMDFAGEVLHHESPLRMRFDDSEEWRAAGEFMPMAERLDATVDVDLAAVTLALSALVQDPTIPGIAINLSGRSLAKLSFKQRLLGLLDDNREAVRRLWLEIPETGALAHLAELEDFCRDVKETGCRLGLEHCGHQSRHLGRFHGLPLDYLKIDARFIRDIDQHEGNQEFLKGLTAIAHGIGLQVIAEGAATQAELVMLRELGFDGATGPAVKN